MATDTVSLLRQLSGQFHDDKELKALIEELSAYSNEFRGTWTAHDVRQRLHGHKRLRHPVAGEITLQYENLTLPDDPGIALTVHPAEPGSPARDALRLLGSVG